MGFSEDLTGSVVNFSGRIDDLSGQGIDVVFVLHFAVEKLNLIFRNLEGGVRVNSSFCEAYWNRAVILVLLLNPDFFEIPIWGVKRKTRWHYQLIHMNSWVSGLNLVY